VAGAGHRSHEGIGARVVEPGGHTVLLLEQEPIEGLARAAMQLDTYGEQNLLGLAEHVLPAIGPVPGKADHGAGQHRRLQGVDVSEAPTTLLELGLQEEGDLAERPVAGVHLLGQRRQPSGRALPPSLPDPLRQPCGQGWVPRHEAGIEQSEGRLQVLAGHGHGLLHRSHAVVQADPRVPHGVPEALGHRLHVLDALVDEEHVEVAAGAQLSAAVPADGDDGDALLRAEQPREPPVGEVGVGPAQCRPPQGRPLELRVG
jgi:hypothetical protein